MESENKECIKNETKRLKEKLFSRKKIVWDEIDKDEKERIMSFAEGYKSFLDNGKTEREVALEIIKFARGKGFKEINDNPSGNKIFYLHRNKCVAMAVFGRKFIEEGLRIVVSHIDSPRLDLKQNPVYEDVNLGLLKTHYYGGIKKYHWVNRPLALHGKIIKRDGSEIELRLGEDSADPVFIVSDLLIHLWRKTQATKKAEEAVEGENLNIIASSIPYARDKDFDQRFKLALLELLFQKYEITEDDFMSAELEAVPAEKARDLGWDRSLICAYGHDDRACAYPALRAIGDLEETENTTLCLFMDKEEIGSEGNTGTDSRFVEYIVGELLRLKGIQNESSLRLTLARSECISADVNSAIEPDWQNLFDKRNAAKIGGGICLTKYGGSGGKSGSNDANAEFVAKIRRILDEKNVTWQTGEIGKVDEGGGGTVAKYMAWSGLDVMDAGVPVLGMHSPCEIISKADLYMTYKAYKSFLESF
ncbi:MAG: aminopeptidase [bacterium]